MTGHTTTAMTEHYSHVTLEELLGKPNKFDVVVEVSPTTAPIFLR